jgi:hypothetical protein
MWNANIRQHHLHGARHRSGLWMEYLRWLQQQSRMFLRPANTEDDIAQLPDSDGNNEIVDKYDEMTRNGTVQPERGPFQNYVVSIFLHPLYSSWKLRYEKDWLSSYEKEFAGQISSSHQSTRRTCTGPASAKLIIILITLKQ